MCLEAARSYCQSVADRWDELISRGAAAFRSQAAADCIAEQQAFTADLEATTCGNDPAAAERLEMRQPHVDCVEGVQHNVRGVSACSRVIEGLMPLGSPCLDGWECSDPEGSGFCAPAGPQGCGICVQRVAALGEPCEYLTGDNGYVLRDCEPTAVCGEDGTCKPRRAVGETCGFDARCSEACGALCIEDAADGTYRCNSGSSELQRCALSGAALGAQNCAYGLSCVLRFPSLSGLEGTCQAPVQQGAACNRIAGSTIGYISEGTLPTCAEPLYCDAPSALGSPGVCSQRMSVPAGGVCHSGDRCVPSQRCLPEADGGMVCLPGVAAGQFCQNSGDCAVNLYCKPGASICAARSTPYQLCDAYDACQPFHSCEDGVCRPHTYATPAPDHPCSTGG